MCDSTFASKNEWKRHVMSQHILLYYWVCQQDLCAKVINSLSNVPGKLVATMGNARPAEPSLPNGAIFNRKDLYTQAPAPHAHAGRHQEQVRLTKTGTRPAAAGGPLQLWEDALRDLQQIGQRERCQLPTFMKCPVPGCEVEFLSANAWDDRMEHVAKHLEKAAAGKEDEVIFAATWTRP